jgi:hypothetical protein
MAFVLNAFAYANKAGARILYTGASLDAQIIRRNVEGGLIHRLIAKPVAPDAIHAALVEELRNKPR